MQVSVVIINYNSSQYTKNCIKSVYQFTKDVSFEIIVVDNASKKEDLDLLKESLLEFEFKLIESKSNMGFGGGNHFGYQFAKGQYLAFLNNDAELTENSFLKLINYIQTDDRIGVIGLEQLDENNERFKYNYRQFIDLRYQFFGQSNPQVYYKNLHGNLDQPFEVDQVSGAFMFMKTENYRLVGGFDPNMFLFYEEMDLCIRLKKIGLKTMFYPNATFIHYLGKSSASVQMKKEFIISYLYVIQKNFTYLYYWVTKVVLLFKYGFKSILKPKKYGDVFMIILKGGNSLVYSMRTK